MIYIYKDRIIRLEWTILKGTSNVKEDFSRALVKLFLIGPADKYLLDATAENGIITAMVPEGLPEGNYSVEVIYAKNWGNLRRGDAPCVPPTAIDPKREPKPVDERFNDRCLMRSRKDDLFGITNYESEADNVGEGEVVVTLKTSVATYGYDGLSSYELSVMRGSFIGSESAFIALINKHVTEHFAKYVNSIHLEWNGNAYLTRIQVIPEMRRKGLMISYVNSEGKAITEKCVFDADTIDAVWGVDSSWQSVEDLVLSGELFVSPNGTWVIDGVDSGINAVGLKGDNGISPLLKTIDNKLHYSYDGKEWLDAGGEHIAAWFRWSGNKIQISRDNKTWNDFSGEFADNLFIKGYVADYASLPTTAVQGDIWGVGPVYAADDTEQTNPRYRYYVRNAGVWVDNGEFTSIAAGIVQETGDGEGVVMSQKAVTEKFTELESEVGRISVIDADGAANTVAAEVGITYKNEIKVNLLKKDVVLAKLVVPDGVFNTESVAVSAHDDTLVGYLPLNEWSELIIPLDTDRIYVGVPSGKVVNAGNVTFHLYIPYDVNSYLGNYPLKSGALAEDMSLVSNSKRQTTGVIRNYKPMRLRVYNDDTSVGLIYGDNLSSLVYGGYIINSGDNKDVVIDVDAKYLIINFVRSVSYSENEWERFIIAPKDSQIWETNKRIDSLEIESVYTPNKSITIYQGLTNPANGKVTENSKRITTGLIPYYGKPLQISINKGYDMACLYAKNGIYTDMSYIISNGGSYVLDVDADAFALNIVRNDSKALTPDEYIGLVITEPKSLMSNIIEYTKKPFDKFVEREIINQFTQATTISDVNNVIAVSDGFDINDNGILCSGCIASSTGVKEYDYPRYKVYLLIANLADVEASKEVVIVCSPSDYIENIGIIENLSNAKAKWTGTDEVTISFIGIFRQTDGIRQVYGNVSVVYNVKEKKFSEFRLCTIKVNGITYPMYSTKYPNAEGVYEYESESITNIETIWQDTGIEHPTGYGGKVKYEYYLGQNPKNIDGVFYAAISLGNQSHTLCKSTDLINWEFVCDIPLGQATEETAICYYNNRIYATSRGNYDVDKQYSKVMYCPIDSLQKESWSEPIVLNKCMGERPTIVGLNNKIYIMQGHGNVSVYTEGVKIARAEKELFVLDVDLNVLKSHVVRFTFPLIHPQFLSFGGNLWTVVSTDKRCYAFTDGGDCRSEIGVAHLDEYLFDL